LELYRALFHPTIDFNYSTTESALSSNNLLLLKKEGRPLGLIFLKMFRKKKKITIVGSNLKK
jgi:hypothetical protein